MKVILRNIVQPGSVGETGREEKWKSKHDTEKK